MTPYNEMMPQVATYWEPGASDGYGDVRLAQGTLVMCRYQSKQTLARSANGQEVTSDTTVYVDRPLKAKGYIILGDYTADDRKPQAIGARQIITVQESPSLDADVALHSVLL